jgi:exosortase
VKTIGYERWQTWHFLLAGALGALAIWLCWPTWLDIWSFASEDAEQSHIVLVPIVAAWMFWARRMRLRNVPPAGTFIGPIILLAGWICSVVGYNHAIQSVWHAGAVAMLVGCILTVLGKHVLFQFLPAFVVLIFLVPIPGTIRQQISLPLQNATAVCTHYILELFGVEVIRSGNLLIINGQQVAVAEACNGMRMVFSLVLVSYAFAFSLPLRPGVRALVLACSPVVALICNVFRLLPTVLIYGYSTQSVGDQFHDWSGWLMLPVGFFLLMGVVRVLKWALLPVMRFTLAYQ